MRERPVEHVDVLLAHVLTLLELPEETIAPGDSLRVTNDTRHRDGLLRERFLCLRIWRKIGRHLRPNYFFDRFSEETIVEVTGWHFEAQYLYYTPMTLYPGDELHLTCR